MEKKCCICGKIFTEKSYNAEPIRKGVCCTNCVMRFVFPVRPRQDVHSNKISSYEIVKNIEEFKNLVKRLKEKNFEQVASSSSIVIFENPETEEKVMICCV